MRTPAATSLQVRRLKYAVQLRRDRVDERNGERPYVGLENIESGTGRLVPTFGEGSSDHAASTSGGDSLCNTFEPGDVLFGKLRPYLAKAWVAEFSGRCTTELLVMQPARFESRFLRYICLSPNFVDAVNASTFGSKMPRADWDFIGNMSVPVPEIAKQRAIADYLDRETARIDRLIAAKERLRALQTEKRRALITRAVTRGLDPTTPLRDAGVPWLGQIPAHWTRMHLKRALRSMDYGISDSVDTAGRVAVLRMGDLQEGEIDYSSVGFVDDVDEALLLQPNDLLFNRTNSLDQIGKVAIFRGNSEFPVTFASYLVRLRCGERTSPEFLNMLLNSAYAVAWGRSEALPAIGQVNLNPNRYAYLSIALPPMSEQRAIIAHIQAETGRLDALAKATDVTIALLRDRRAALISAAVTGVLAPVEQ